MMIIIKKKDIVVKMQLLCYWNNDNIMFLHSIKDNIEND